MNTTPQFLLVTAISVLMGGCLHAQAQQRLAAVVQRVAGTGANGDASPLKFSGTVTDSAGNPVAGATVEYWPYIMTGIHQTEPMEQRKMTTAADGGFAIQVSRDTGVLLVRKPGLAPAWKQLAPGVLRIRETGNQIVLTPPGTLAGTVVGETNQPIVNAEVFALLALSELPSENGPYALNYLGGKPARECFSARTDAAGHFQLENFPTNASAVLSVRSPGRALQPSTEAVSDPRMAGYRAGQADIRLVMEVGGIIEGRIVGGDTNALLPVARLNLQPEQPGFFGSSAIQPVTSSTNGVFRFTDIAAGSYRIQVVFGTNTPPDWVAEAISVSVEAGQATRGVQVTAERGALLKVSVLGKEDHKPLAQVNVSAFRKQSSGAAVSDTNGVAWLRLLPGDYQLSAFQQSLLQNQASATVEAGRTNQVELEMATPRKISGIIHKPDGQVAAGVSVRLVGGFGRGDADVTTDADGKFSLEWNQRQFGGQSDSTVCILARDMEHNLAVAQDIDEDTGALDLKLAPGLTLVSRTEAEGKHVTNATAQVVFLTGRSGMYLPGMARTNTPGRIEIPALPPGRKYGVIVSAPGYGQKQLNNIESSGEAIRQELDPVELKLANLKLAGQVLDADDKPVTGCYVNLSGDGQPNAHVSTDRQGRFVFPHVCEGAAQLSANAMNSFGHVSAEGGDTNVVMRLGSTYGSSPQAAMHQLKGTVTDDATQPAAGALLAVFPNNGTRWVKAGTKGEFSLTWSLQPWQARSGNALLVVRDQARNLAATEEVSEDATNLAVKLKPALTVTGQVKHAGDSPLTNAQVGLWLKTGNSYNTLNEQMSPVNREGRYEIKCLPPDAPYRVYATARGYGKSQQQVEPGSETNRMELAPFVLMPADRLIAGQVLNDNDKPASGVNVQLNGEDQPDGNMTTDSKGRFHFQVCEGKVRLFAYSQNGGGSAQATAEGGDTNIIVRISTTRAQNRREAPATHLKGKQLPDLAPLGLTPEQAPTDQALLTVLVDAEQRPSRRALRLLGEQAAAIKGNGVAVIVVHAGPMTEDALKAWKQEAAVAFPVGCLKGGAEKARASWGASALPWLILTDKAHRVTAEGFPLEELDAKLKDAAK